MTGEPKHHRHTLKRRLTCLTLVILFCASVFPILNHSFFNHSKDLSQPFPCQDRACGCRSAAQCWQKCCCFTNSEKVAWARKKKISLPKFVVAAAAAEESSEIEDSERTSLIVESVKGLGPTNRQSQEAKNSLKPEESQARIKKCCFSDSDKKKVKSDRKGAIVFIEAMKCRGQGDFFSAIPWTTLPVPFVSIISPPPGGWERLTSEIPKSAEQEPPEPPPRLFT